MTDKERLLPSLGSLWAKPAFNRFRSDLDSLFDNFFDDFFVDRSVFDDIQSKGSFPKINVSETDDKYNVEIAVAGFSKDDVNLELKENTLFISAENKNEGEENSEDKNYLRREISYRSFQRAVRFPCKIDVENIEANYKDGVISVDINKMKEEDKNCGVSIKIS